MTWVPVDRSAEGERRAKHTDVAERDSKSRCALIRMHDPWQCGLCCLLFCYSPRRFVCSQRCSTTTTRLGAEDGSVHRGQGQTDRQGGASQPALFAGLVEVKESRWKGLKCGKSKVFLQPSMGVTGYRCGDLAGSRSTGLRICLWSRRWMGFLTLAFRLCFFLSARCCVPSHRSPADTVPLAPNPLGLRLAMARVET
ncbi:hypothetical protein VTI74DRAFT_9800 [Chaetomium olivicolor]